MINQALIVFNKAFRQVKEYAWPIVATLLVIYFLNEQWTHYKQRYIGGNSLVGSTTNTGSSTTTAISGSTSSEGGVVVDHQEALRQARQRQQEIQNERAQQAAEERKKKIVEERHRKVQEVDDEYEKKMGTGKRLGEKLD